MQVIRASALCTEEAPRMIAFAAASGRPLEPLAPSTDRVGHRGQAVAVAAGGARYRTLLPQADWIEFSTASATARRWTCRWKPRS